VLSVEYVGYEGAGSGEFAGCAHNIFLKDRFLFGARDIFCGITEGQAGFLFEVILIMPFFLIVSLLFLGIGYAFSNRNLIHIGMLPIDVFVIIFLFALFFPVPVFSFVGPFRGHTTG
jgi:hypothetical protein